MPCLLQLAGHLQADRRITSNHIATVIDTENITWAFSDTNLFTRWSIGDAGLMVDVDQVVFIRDRLRRTNFDAHLAANAADLTNAGHRFAEIFCGAGHPDSCPQGLNLDNLFRAGLDTNTAADAFVGTDHREIIDHLDGIKRTRFGAFAETDTRILAGGRAAKTKAGSGTG